MEGKPHLIVPYSLSNNDGKFIRGNFATGQHFFEYMRDAIDVLRAEGATAPKMMSIGLHMRDHRSARARRRPAAAARSRQAI